MVTMENVTLKQATFSKFQPQTVDFLDITDPKAVYPRANIVVELWVTYTTYMNLVCAGFHYHMVFETLHTKSSFCRKYMYSKADFSFFFFLILMALVVA